MEENKYKALTIAELFYMSTLGGAKGIIYIICLPQVIIVYSSSINGRSNRKLQGTGKCHLNTLKIMINTNN